MYEDIWSDAFGVSEAHPASSKYTLVPRRLVPT